ncbi:hypothetical protein SCOCK_300035 [Actinacidiphila cocklensis]|uniref:Soluble ligand binding domain-containing protein n=1 Tax=Actinacidiphila cocklensis TaxID=887465 RepID=A0A9W4GSX9_9ACTN|nr:hypothetical protein SCOCK_300035 [Actinacidiphila cocklensis]
METLAHVPLIARYRPDWFRELGSRQAPGTTLVTLSGAIRSPGVYEVPMGSPVGQALAAGGGPTRRLGAVLAGGFFGSWLPVPLDPAAPARGAGVLVALPEDTCGLAETAAALAYLGSQSARQCGPCMFGVPSVAEDFAELAWGRPCWSGSTGGSGSSPAAAPAATPTAPPAWLPPPSRSSPTTSTSTSGTDRAPTPTTPWCFPCRMPARPRRRSGDEPRTRTEHRFRRLRRPRSVRRTAARAHRSGRMGLPRTTGRRYSFRTGRPRPPRGCGLPGAGPAPDLRRPRGATVRAPALSAPYARDFHGVREK